MEKINIYVPEKTGLMLDNDAKMFEVLKKSDKSINKNRFLNMIILGYYKDYVSEAGMIYDKIISVMDTDKLSSEDKSKIADDVLKKVVLPEVPSRKGKNPKRLSLKPTKKTEALIELILRDLGDKDYISQFFCRMFMSYCSKPFSERERILFKENYEILREACLSNKSITFKTIWNDKDINEVIPYKVVTGSEEMFNYLLCVENNKYTGMQQTRSFRLNRIKNINMGTLFMPVDDTAQHYLDMMIKYGPQYTINDDEETCVRLTESGMKSYNRIYYGRPEYDRDDNRDGYKYLYFKCSKNQVFLYFRRFGPNEVEIISPEWLRNQMIEFHRESLVIYQ